MKSKLIVIGLLSLIICDYAGAQDTESTSLSKFNIYADLGGHFGAQASLNFEGHIYSGEKSTWYARGGLGAAGIIMATGGPGVLAGVTMLTGKENKHFELNAGAFVGKDFEQDNMYVFPLIDLGYRYQKPEGGFIFKAKLGFLGIGIGLGYAFK